MPGRPQRRFPQIKQFGRHNRVRTSATCNLSNGRARIDRSAPWAHSRCSPPKARPVAALRIVICVPPELTDAEYIPSSAGTRVSQRELISKGLSPRSSSSPSPEIRSSDWTSTRRGVFLLSSRQRTGGGRPLLEDPHRRGRRTGAMRLVQGQVRRLLAGHPPRARGTLRPARSTRASEHCREPVPPAGSRSAPRQRSWCGPAARGWRARRPR